MRKPGARRALPLLAALAVGLATPLTASAATSPAIAKGGPAAAWVYSNTGAGTYHPAPGSVQGWAFGAGQPPGISPP
jgi:hypothetical protein